MQGGEQKTCFRPNSLKFTQTNRLHDRRSILTYRVYALEPLRWNVSSRCKTRRQHIVGEKMKEKSERWGGNVSDHVTGQKLPTSDVTQLWNKEQGERSVSELNSKTSSFAISSTRFTYQRKLWGQPSPVQCNAAKWRRQIQTEWRTHGAERDTLI